MASLNASPAMTSLMRQDVLLPSLLTNDARKQLRAAQGPTAKLHLRQKKRGTLDVAKYQGQRWVTRRNLHIDRLASAWLIKQFIDKRPRFYFVAEGETVEGAIPFDMFGAEFTHHGEDCTFETMLKQFGLVKTKACARSLRSFTTSI